MMFNQTSEIAVVKIYFTLKFEDHIWEKSKWRKRIAADLENNGDKMEDIVKYPKQR